MRFYASCDALARIYLTKLKELRRPREGGDPASLLFTSTLVLHFREAFFKTTSTTTTLDSRLRGNDVKYYFFFFGPMTMII
jgi:hypothetical protein